MKRTVIASAVLALAVAAPAFAQAPNVQGGSSNPSNVQVGPSDFPQQAPAGFAGISMKRNDGAWSGYVNIFAAPIKQVTTYAEDPNLPGPFYALHQDGEPIAQVWYNDQNSTANVYSLRQLRYLDALHPHFGGLVIGQVKGYGMGNGVYFGEWSPPVNGTPNQGDSTDLNMTNAGRTVWYVGDNAVTSMPTLINAEYSVAGIRQTGVGNNPPYEPNLYTGTLTANYVGGIGAITGSISRSGDNAVSFNGTAIYANGTFNNGSTIEGRFYNNAAALAGIYTGGASSSDHIAFGGSRSN